MKHVFEQEISGLFAHPYIFAIKETLSAKIMCGILSDFMYCLNCNILSFSNEIAIPEKLLFSHTFSCEMSVFSVLKE